jgi:hypothetical protein
MALMSVDVDRWLQDTLRTILACRTPYVYRRKVLTCLSV